MPYDRQNFRPLARVIPAFDDMPGALDEIVRQARNGHVFNADDGMSSSDDGRDLIHQPNFYARAR